MATTYKGVDLPNCHVKVGLPPTAWQKDSFAGADGEIAADLGKRGCQITVDGIIKDITGIVYEPSLSSIIATDDGTSGSLKILGIGTYTNVIIDTMEIGEMVTYPNPSSNSGTLKGARYTINFYRLSSGSAT